MQVEPDDVGLPEPEDDSAGAPPALQPIDDDDPSDFSPPIADTDAEAKELDAAYKARPKKKTEFILARQAERRAKYQRELAARDARIAALEAQMQERVAGEQKAAMEGELSKLNSKRASLQKQWIEATEQGRTEDVAKLNSQINEVDFDIRSTRTVIDARPNAAPAPVAPRLDGWVQAVGFRGWSEEERQVAAAVDRALLRSGMTHDSDEYYVEMSRRLSAALPDRAKIIAKHAPVAEDEADEEEGEDEEEAPPQRKGKKTVDQPQTTTRRRPGVAAVASDARAPVTDDLPRENWKHMRALGLDPQDADVRKAFRQSMVRKGYLSA